MRHTLSICQKSTRTFTLQIQVSSCSPYHITCHGKTNLMLDSVSSNNCLIIPKHTLASNQLQIQQRTVSLFASACLILQLHEVNHKTILDLPFKQLVASLGYLWPCKIRLKFRLNFKWLYWQILKIHTLYT